MRTRFARQFLEDEWGRDQQDPQFPPPNPHPLPLFSVCSVFSPVLNLFRRRAAAISWVVCDECFRQASSLGQRPSPAVITSRWSFMASSVSWNLYWKQSLRLSARYAPRNDNAAGLAVWVPALSKSNPATAPVIKSGIRTKSPYHSSDWEFAVVNLNEMFLFTISINVI